MLGMGSERMGGASSSMAVPAGMRLYANPTSPFVRVVRMALHEKGLAGAVEVVMVDAWGDAPAFLDANPAGRVPVLLGDGGMRLAEAPLILHFLDDLQPDPPVLPRGAGAAAALSRAGLAFGVFEAATAIIIGRKSAADFDAGMVGQKRHRTMRTGFARLDAACPAPGLRGLDIADMAAITALDYAVFRFPDEDWRALAPRTAALRDANAERPSVKETAPVG